MIVAPAEQPPPASPTARNVLLYGVGVILIASLLFGVMAVCVRVAAREMAAVQITFFRFAGALLVLLAGNRGGSLRPRRGNLPAVLLRGLLGASAILLYFEAIARAGAAFATMLHGTYPIFTALFAAAFLGEPYGPRLLLSLPLSLVGTAVVVGPAARQGGPTVAGALCALAAGILAGAAVTAARHLRSTESAMLITIHFMAIGALATVPSLLLGLPHFSPTLVIALLGTILSSALAQILLHLGLGFAPAAQGSIAAVTSVLAAALLEVLFLGEHLQAHTVIGGVLLIGSVPLALGSPRRR